MKRTITCVFGVFAFLIAVNSVTAQADDICREFGTTPSLDSPFANIPYIYGKVALRVNEQSSKSPKVTVVLVDPQQSQKRLTIEKSGNYCFRRSSGSNGTLLVEVDGVEIARRSFSSFGPAQQREDFDINLSGPGNTVPGVVSAKFSRPPNEKTVELYSKAAEAEKAKDHRETVRILKEIVAIDPSDYIAWAKLGAVYVEQKALPEADAAYRKSIENKLEYTPAWINVGQLRLAQKQYEAAVEVLKHAASLDPESARTFQLLGEAYLLSKQGTLGAQALNEAIRLDPTGMAECHLQLAHLYQLAGAKQLASKEYKAFLSKVPSHPDRKKFEKFLKDNPE